MSSLGLGTNATGLGGSDVVFFGGLTASNQSFGGSVFWCSCLPSSCTVTPTPTGTVTNTSGTIIPPVASGLLGLAWQNLSVLGAPPLWATLLAEGQLDQPVMSLQLNRAGNASKATSIDPSGGWFTLGCVYSHSRGYRVFRSIIDLAFSTLLEFRIMLVADPMTEGLTMAGMSLISHLRSSSGRSSWTRSQ